MKMNQCLVINYIYIVSPPPLFIPQTNLVTFLSVLFYNITFELYSLRHPSFDMQYRDAKALQ